PARPTPRAWRPGLPAVCSRCGCRASGSAGAGVARCPLGSPKKEKSAREPEPVLEYDGKVHFEIPEAMPLLPIRDLVVFPYMIVPLLVSRDISVEAVNMALSSSKERLVFLAAQHDIGEEDPSPEAIYTTGTVGMIMRMRKLSDGRIKILVQGL